MTIPKLIGVAQFVVALTAVTSLSGCGSGSSNGSANNNILVLGGTVSTTNNTQTPVGPANRTMLLVHMNETVHVVAFLDTTVQSAKLSFAKVSDNAPPAWSDMAAVGGTPGHWQQDFSLNSTTNGAGSPGIYAFSVQVSSPVVNFPNRRSKSFHL